MAQNELLQAIEAIGREKGIEREVIIRALEEAYAAASRKVMKSHENIVSIFDEKTGEFGVFARKRVVPEVLDDETEISLEDAIEIDPQADFDQELTFPREVPDLGRIAAQAAKQVIYQKVKEAEREKIYSECIDRVGELVNGIVKRVERGDLIVDMGSTEAAVPRREQVRTEHYNPGDRIRAIIGDVEKSGKGPQVVLSRTDPRLVLKLFEMEVPEIYDGTVRVVAVARDAGERSKIAVQSRDRDVDPVGACVGMKGNRVQSVIRELRGEKIDIVQYHEEPMAFVREALKPATANRVGSRDDDRRVVEVIVADEQLSLAIGKRGQNVRLAGRLVGWRIDVKSESEKRTEVDAEHDARVRANHLFARLGIDDPVIFALIEAGFRDLEQILSADFEDLTRIPGIDEETALDIHDKAEGLIDLVREEDEQARRVREEMTGGTATDSVSDDIASFLREAGSGHGAGEVEDAIADLRRDADAADKNSSAEQDTDESR